MTAEKTEAPPHLKEFLEQYTRAREIQADRMIEEIISISDDSALDEFEDADGNTKVNHDHINRSRLRVDSRKWVASKMKPKKYGDRITTEHEGKVSISLEDLVMGSFVSTSGDVH